MKTIYKLVLKSYLGPMVLTFFIIMFVLMMNVLWRYIDVLVGKGLDPGTIIELLCYATINMIPDLGIVGCARSWTASRTSSIATPKTSAPFTSAARGSTRLRP